MALQTASKDELCPICEKPDWCYKPDKDLSLWCCKRSDTASSGWYRTSKKDDDGSWYFAVEQNNKRVAKPRVMNSKRVVKTAKYSAEERDLIISQLAQELNLNSEHLAILNERGLDDQGIYGDEMRSLNYFSIPAPFSADSAVIPDYVPNDFPGIGLTKKGGKYLTTTKNEDGEYVGGIAIITRNTNGLATGWKLMTIPRVESKKYVYPINVKLPVEGNAGGEFPLQVAGLESATAWLVEGELKGNLTKVRLHSFGDDSRVIGASSGYFSNSPVQFKEAIGASKKVILAVDAGDIINLSRLKHWKKEIAFFEKLKLQVSIAWWGQMTKDDNDIDELTTQAEFDAIEFIDPVKFFELNSDSSTDKEPTKEKEKPPTPLDLAKTATYFHTADKVAYADIWIDGNRHTYAVRSKMFKLWLMGEQYRTNRSGINSQSFQDTLPTLEAIAIFDGETREVHLRTAEHQGKLYLDLGSSDWKTVEIDNSGWRIISEPPVRFWRPDSMLPLPDPVAGGNLETLNDLLNVDGSSWILIVTFLLFCFCPGKRYPILVLAAHRGSGKTAAAEILKGLVDPGKAGLIKLQNDTLKLAVSAACRHLMVYDNVGHISPDQSDDLCRVATGFGYSTRTLHTTGDETTFEFTRPQIITAIDALVTRDDLADRVLMAQLPEIPRNKRLPQEELDLKIETARPLILGALLTALSQTLAQLPHTKRTDLPRMADYALFGIASEKALGLKEGQFMAVFDESREQSRQVVIESSPVGEAIIRLMENYPIPMFWKGTASELLNELAKHTDEATYRSRFFPKAANSLTRQLNRLAPDLKAIGLDIRNAKEGNAWTRYLYIQKVVKVSSVPSTPSATQHKPFQSNNSNADDNPDGTFITDANSVCDTVGTDAPLNTVGDIVGDSVGDETNKGQSFRDIADGTDGTDDIIPTFPVMGEVEKTEKNIAVSDRVFIPAMSEYGTVRKLYWDKAEDNQQATVQLEKTGKFIDIFVENLC
jgi:energy-coupling factor transporter ATP-binding protein EcfA2